MTVNAITDTKEGRTGIAPTYLHTTHINSNSLVSLPETTKVYIKRKVVVYLFKIFYISTPTCSNTYYKLVIMTRLVMYYVQTNSNIKHGSTV